MIENHCDLRVPALATTEHASVWSAAATPCAWASARSSPSTQPAIAVFYHKAPAWQSILPVVVPVRGVVESGPVRLRPNDQLAWWRPPCGLRMVAAHHPPCAPSVHSKPPLPRGATCEALTTSAVESHVLLRGQAAEGHFSISAVVLAWPKCSRAAPSSRS